MPRFPSARGVPQRHAWGVLSKEYSLVMAASQPVDKQQCLEKVYEKSMTEAASTTFEAEQSTKTKDCVGIPARLKHIFSPHTCHMLLIACAPEE